MNKLIKPFTGILFILAIGFTGYAQMRFQRVPVQRPMPLNRLNGARPGRRIEVVKENFIGRQLKLTPDEARAFWPLYRQYVQDQTAVQILKRQNNSNQSANGTEQIDKELAYESQLVEIRKQYSEEFKKILPPEKVSELYKSEREFKDEVLKQLSERNGIRVGG